MDLRGLDCAEHLRRHFRQRVADSKPTHPELRPHQFLAINPHHLFGTDDLGRDIFSRVVYGSRISITVGLGAMLIGFGFGAPLGMLAAYRRGKFDAILSDGDVRVLGVSRHHRHDCGPVLLDTTSLLKIIIVVGIAAIPLVYRVIRAATINIATKDYVVAAKVQGASDFRILVKELLPNVAPIGVSFLLIGIATVITLEGSLAFLGLSVNPPTPSWGNMINESRTILAQNPWLVTFPALAMCLFLLSLNFIGDRLRSHYDVTEVKL